VTAYEVPPPGGKPLAEANAHGILDIPAISLGSVVRSVTADDDLLAEMLESRP
jgi:hypothetical protein